MIAQREHVIAACRLAVKADQAISNEAMEKIVDIAKQELPKKQYDVLMLFFEGYSYQEIMSKLSLKNTKQVDNALASARRTLRDLLSE